MVHPPLDDITLESLFYALGDKTRLRILSNIYAGGENPIICAEATAGIANLSQSTSSHHFRILRESGLVHSERKGKECYNTLRLSELETKFPSLMKTVLDLIDGT
jgi:DNA-binding transcriptional ArsR family regulator